MDYIKSEVSEVSSTPIGNIGGIANEAPNTHIAIVQFDWSAQLFITGKGKVGYLRVILRPLI